jgi:hypothetical protein
MVLLATQRQKTILITTHYIEEAKQVGHHTSSFFNLFVVLQGNRDLFGLWLAVGIKPFYKLHGPDLYIYGRKIVFLLVKKVYFLFSSPFALNLLKSLLNAQIWSQKYFDTDIKEQKI